MQASGQFCCTPGRSQPEHFIPASITSSCAWAPLCRPDQTGEASYREELLGVDAVENLLRLNLCNYQRALWGDAVDFFTQKIGLRVL